MRAKIHVVAPTRVTPIALPLRPATAAVTLAARHAAFLRRGDARASPGRRAAGGAAGGVALGARAPGVGGRAFGGEVFAPGRGRVFLLRGPPLGKDEDVGAPGLA